MTLTDKTDSQLLAVATTMMDDLMAASFAVDYDAHVRDFTPRLKALVTEDGFQKMALAHRRDLGDDAGRALVRVLRRRDSVAFVWVQRFTKSDDEYLATAILCETGDGFKIDHALIC